MSSIPTLPSLSIFPSLLASQWATVKHPGPLTVSREGVVRDVDWRTYGNKWWLHLSCHFVFCDLFFLTSMAILHQWSENNLQTTERIVTELISNLLGEEEEGWDVREDCCLFSEILLSRFLMLSGVGAFSRIKIRWTCQSWSLSLWVFILRGAPGRRCSKTQCIVHQ